MAREEFENMKVKSLVTLGVTLLLIVLIGLLAVNGMHVGKYIFKSVGDSVEVTTPGGSRSYEISKVAFKK